MFEVRKEPNPKSLKVREDLNMIELSQSIDVPQEFEQFSQPK